MRCCLLKGFCLFSSVNVQFYRHCCLERVTIQMKSALAWLPFLEKLTVDSCFFHGYVKTYVCVEIINEGVR